MRLATFLLSCTTLAGQQISGELKQWHDVVLTFDGPATSESADPNPFLTYRMNVTFTKGADFFKSQFLHAVPHFDGFICGGPFVFAQVKHGVGVDEIIDHVVHSWQHASGKEHSH